MVDRNSVLYIQHLLSALFTIKRALSRYVLKCTKDEKKTQYVYILKSNQCAKIDFVKHIVAIYNNI